MKRFMVFFFLLTFAFPAEAYKHKDVPDVDFPTSVTLGGRELRLIGVGMRQATIFHVNVYVLAAYAERRSCALQNVIASDQARLLRLHFVRDVSADTMRSNMEKSFARKTPKDASPQLRDRISTFITLFGIEAKKGTDVEVRYEPGSGTSVYVNGQKRGPTIPGDDFIKIVWSIYFDEDTCCPNLRKEVLRSCNEIQ